MTINTNEPTIVLVNNEFSGIIKWALKISNVHYDGGKNMKACFLQLVWIRQIFGIVGFQIEIERIFS
jgi:hypothetical protein